MSPHRCGIFNGQHVEFVVGIDNEGRERAENVEFVDWGPASNLQTEMEILVPLLDGIGTGVLPCGCKVKVFRDRFNGDWSEADALQRGARLMGDLVIYSVGGSPRLKATNVSILYEGEDQ